MPNHITNRIIASPKVIEALVRFHTDAEKAEMIAENAKTAANYQARTGNPWPYAEQDAAKIEERFVDFALVVPEPDNLFRGGCDMKHPHRDDQGKELVCWYSWNVNAWGTKWNGYDTHIEPLEGDLCKLEFDTAWSHPVPVIGALADLFLDEEIKVWWADEDMGENVGYYVLPAGAEARESDDVVVYDLSGTDAGMELACELKRGMTYAEYQAENAAEEIDWAQRHKFADERQVKEGIDKQETLGAIYKGELEVPDEIKAQITTVEQAEAYWESETVDG